LSKFFFKRIVEIIAVAVVYVATARLGELFSLPPGNATPVWLPSGIMLAWALVRGKYIWPGVFIGALSGNLLAYLDPSSLSLILKTVFIGSANGLGDVISMISAVWVINRATGVNNPFGKMADVSWFLLFGGVLGPLASALTGVTALALVNTIQWEAGVTHEFFAEGHFIKI
jgi:integral membrane sensor domain MASE1